MPPAAGRLRVAAMKVEMIDEPIVEPEVMVGHPDPTGAPGEKGVDRAQLAKRLRELAEVDPPVCHHDEPEEITVFGQKITVYCKPFEQFQFLLKMAADTIEAEPVRHGRWEEYQEPHIVCCSECDWGTGVQDKYNYCPNCGAKMDGGGGDDQA